MILNNIVIGLDRVGNKLECGDICTYEYREPINNTRVKDTGMIVYDDDTFSFYFEQLDDNYPFIAMRNVDRASIKLWTNARYMDSWCPNSEEWVQMYNNNLLKAHLD